MKKIQNKEVQFPDNETDIDKQKQFYQKQWWELLVPELEKHGWYRKE